MQKYPLYYEIEFANRTKIKGDYAVSEGIIVPSSPRADALWKDKGDGKTLRDRGLARFHHYRKKWLEAISFQVQNNHAIARREGTWRLIGWKMVEGYSVSSSKQLCNCETRRHLEVGMTEDGWELFRFKF